MNKNTQFLVVDDFQMMRNIVKKMLLEQGFKNITMALDGIDAKNKITEAEAAGNPIHFVVSGWNMPNMSGLELLKYVRSTEKYADIPFIMVTAESEQKQIIEAIKSKVSEYIVKPFNDISFKQKLENVSNRLAAKQKAA